MRIRAISLAILLMIGSGCSLGDSKEYLKGAITVDKINNNGEIEKITFHFKDFFYNVSTDCRLASKNIDNDYSDPERTVFQINPINDPERIGYEWNDPYWLEKIDLTDRDSPFVGEINEYSRPLNEVIT